jgi:hypothetical protein
MSKLDLIKDNVNYVRNDHVRKALEGIVSYLEELDRMYDEWLAHCTDECCDALTLAPEVSENDRDDIDADFDDSDADDEQTQTLIDGPEDPVDPIVPQQFEITEASDDEVKDDELVINEGETPFQHLAKDKE